MSGPRTFESPTSPLLRGVQALGRALYEPIDVAPLAYFRIIFGAIMVWEAWRYFRYGWIRHLYIEPIFHFTYLGFDWVRPWPGDWIYVHFIALGILAALILVGMCYRLATILFFLGFTHVFLLCQSLYLNHFYLIVLLSFLMIFIPAHRDHSVDAFLYPSIRGRWVPVWTLWLLRAQIGIVYLFGGIAKLNADWLRGEPLRTWLARRAGYPVVGRWFTEEWVVYAFSYGGLLIDLLVVPMLLWRRTRRLAVVALLAFHLINASLFSIGVFPWLMLAATPLFFPPQALRRLLGGRPSAPPTGLPTTPSRRSRRATMALLGIYLGLQVLIPLRHHLYPDDVSWTEEGHNFSWQMKLRDKVGAVHFAANDPISGAYLLIDPADCLTSRQVRKMSTRPAMILQFAHFLADFYREAGYPDIQIRALAYSSLNGRPMQRLVGPDVDLAAQPRTLWPAPWIVPLKEPRAGAPLAGHDAR